MGAGFGAAANLPQNMHRGVLLGIRLESDNKRYVDLKPGTAGSQANYGPCCPPAHRAFNDSWAVLKFGPPEGGPYNDVLDRRLERRLLRNGALPASALSPKLPTTGRRLPLRLQLANDAFKRVNHFVALDGALAEAQT
jgi:hypothetical protein